jgi:hypothetical protein
MALAWLIPGLGHYYLGKRRSAVAFAAIVTLTLLAGLSFQGRLYTIEAGQLTILATPPCAELACQHRRAALVENPSDDPLGDLRVRVRLPATAGLMNLLRLDAYDFATGRKR